MTIAFPENNNLAFYKPSRNISNSCSSRQTPGPICENCAQLSNCVNLGNSNWLTVPVRTCDESQGLFCTESSNACLNIPSACNPNHIPFTCNTAGIFPDPYDCQIYHFCYADGSGDLVKATSFCDGDSAFSAASGDCSAKVDENCFSQFSCWPEVGPWSGNSNIFYVCTLLAHLGGLVQHPQLFRCDAGLSFSDGICA